MTLPSHNDKPATAKESAKVFAPIASVGRRPLTLWECARIAIVGNVVWTFAVLLIGVGVSCNSTGNPVTGENPALPPIAASDTAIGKAEADVTGIRDAGTKLEPHVAQPGIPLLAWMQDAASRALENLSVAKAENANAKAAVIASEKARDVETRKFVAQIEARDREIAALKGDWFYVAGTWIRFFWWLIVAYVAFAIVGRIAALFIGGWFGGVLAWASELAFVPITGGLSLVLTLCNNAFWRDRVGKLNPQLVPGT